MDNVHNYNDLVFSPKFTLSFYLLIEIYILFPSQFFFLQLLPGMQVNTPWKNYSSFAATSSSVCNSDCIKGCSHLKICRERKNWMYSVLPSVGALVKEYESNVGALSNGTMLFHEIISAKIPHKYFLDIDLEITDVTKSYHSSHAFDLDYRNREILLDIILDGLKNCIYLLSQMPSSVNVYDSSNSKKISFHVVLQGIKTKSENDAKLFAECVRSKSGPLGTCVDMAVYKSNQNLRLLNTTKIDKKRYKTLCNKISYDIFSDEQVSWMDVDTSTMPGVPTEKELSESMVTYVEETEESYVNANSASLCIQSGFFPSCLTKKKSRATYPVVNLWRGEGATAYFHSNPPMETAIENWTSEYFSAPFSLRLNDKNTQNFLIMNRLKEGLCPLCKRKHRNDNVMVLLSKSLFLTTDKTNPLDCDLSVVFKCWRDWSKASGHAGILKIRGSQCLVEKSRIAPSKHKTVKKAPLDFTRPSRCFDSR